MRLLRLVTIATAATLVSCAAPSGSVGGKPGAGPKVVAPLSAGPAAVGVQEASLRTEAPALRFVGGKPGSGVRVARQAD